MPWPKHDDNSTIVVCNGYLQNLITSVIWLRLARHFDVIASSAGFQEGLALATGIDRSHMGKIERGERNLTILNLIRIAQALRRTPSELLASAGM
ncbi:helix-turn-helix protein [Paraburkholderia sp. BL9I2N2]|nr:helix-turn-helix protein [Paraburkholderia sp. BL9I2N2]